MRESGTIRDKIWDTLYYADLSPEQFHQIRKPVTEDNRRSVMTWSLSICLFWGVSLIFSFFSVSYASCRPVYIAAILLNLLSFIWARTLAKKRPRTLDPCILLFKATLMGAGLGIALCQPHDRTVTLIAFAIISPTSFISRSISDIVLNLLVAAAYMLLARGVLDPEVYSWGLRNYLIFSVAGLLIGHFINRARFERFLYAESTATLADIQMIYAYSDQLTGLKNRRSYEEELRKLSGNVPADLCLIVADLNGLKEMNDTRGHDAGDRLIAGAAKCLTDAFDNTDGIYRTGGDEFCILLHGTEEEVASRLEKLDQLSSGWNGSGISGISISIGFACSRDYPDLKALEQAADQKMYASKRDFYLTHGMDRRKR